MNPRNSSRFALSFGIIGLLAAMPAAHAAAASPSAERRRKRLLNGHTAEVLGEPVTPPTPAIVIPVAYESSTPQAVPVTILQAMTTATASNQSARRNAAKSRAVTIRKARAFKR